MGENITIESLIEQVRQMIRYQELVVYDTPLYEKFHKDVTEYVFANFLDTTEHWDYIQKFLMWKSTQYLIEEEANAILTGLENIRMLMLKRINEKKNPFWQYIHPIIIIISQELFVNKHYFQAVQGSFVEINDRIKKIRLKLDGKELDGVDLMMKTFSETQPLFCFEEIATESGKNIQEGYKYIFAGVMKCIRNPNAHRNIEISRDDAVRKLTFASLLMYKIDDAVTFNNIDE